jgi:hypothetical protein
MQNAIRISYSAVCRNEPPATPMVLLHIGDDQTTVVSGMGPAPEQVLLLEIGARRTCQRFF